MAKSWWKSKTLWVNTVAAVALFVQSQYGYVIGLDLQGYGLVIINTFVRTITHEDLE